MVSIEWVVVECSGIRYSERVDGFLFVDHDLTIENYHRNNMIIRQPNESRTQKKVKKNKQKYRSFYHGENQFM